MTGIITTLGPAVKLVETLQKFYDLGVRILRFNFPHFDYSSAEEYISLIKKVKQTKEDPFLLLLDTQGPSVRLGSFSGELSFAQGELFRLVVKEEDVNIEKKYLFCDYPFLIEDSSVGDIIRIDSGLFDVEVLSKGDGFLELSALRNAKIIQKRHINLPGIKLRLPAISEKDKKDISFAAKHDFDYVALSFVSSEHDVLQVRDLLKKEGKENIKIVSKIENAAAIEDIDDIVEYSDVVMVARGDLGVELPVRAVPRYQRMIVDKCKKINRKVIVATEMLESMMHRPVPTRAEVSDIYCSVEMGADFVMLSGETSVGEYPVECVEVMKSVIGEAGMGSEAPGGGIAEY